MNKGKYKGRSDFWSVMLHLIAILMSMKKGTVGPSLLKLTSLHPENKKEDHSSYFETLEQKLLYESDKISTLIGKPSSSPDSRSIKGSPEKLPPRQLVRHFDEEGAGEKDPSSSSILLQNYLQGKKNQLNSSKSQYFLAPKEKESQMQRKLTYNLVRPPEETNSEQSFVFIQEVSPCKSDKVNDHLKKTSSSTSSVALKTIDRMKKMYSLGARSSLSKPLPPVRAKGPCIEDFEILKYLEEGQFGAVYLAVHRQANFICALKKIPKRIFEGEARFINQLVREVKIQSYLDHPNIVQLYACFSDEEHLYLILQPCCGGNVYSSLRKEGRFQEERVRNMVRQVSHAIEFMHDSDIIHRDIKPENILLHEGIVKVCDFGWSIHSPLLRDTRCGTPLYSSPEVVQKMQYDNKVDVWNIGIFTFELLFGRVPFEIRDEEDLVKVVDDDIYFPKGASVSAQAKDFVLRCLHKNPKDRESMNKLVDNPFIQP